MLMTIKHTLPSARLRFTFNIGTQLRNNGKLSSSDKKVKVPA